MWDWLTYFAILSGFPRAIDLIDRTIFGLLQCITIRHDFGSGQDVLPSSISVNVLSWKSSLEDLVQGGVRCFSPKQLTL